MYVHVHVVERNWQFKRTCIASWFLFSVIVTRKWKWLPYICLASGYHRDLLRGNFPFVLAARTHLTESMMKRMISWTSEWRSEWRFVFKQTRHCTFSRILGCSSSVLTDCLGWCSEMKRDENDKPKDFCWLGLLILIVVQRSPWILSHPVSQCVKWGEWVTRKRQEVKALSV